ncbi:hypothetical protein WH52_11695 [Tenacibaculum holothuriorum]|uniref:DUF4468 domain-containing protein n=1 Tax=Tenacibaculum holothuriorum TaxID=1635173 RepID=A0A1Y2PBZ5_9FLAO|nr:hypothetical protein [Tenacibaculum holothuriorum]OSY87307.1 hypothetical protein WH52_11695 [Tenacibaculum holothuriorum]
MKKLVFTFTLVVFSLTSVVAQTTPVTPTPPNSSSTTVSTSSTTSRSYSVDDNGKYSSHSIAVKNHNSAYRFRARFNDALTERVKNRLEKEFSGKNFSKPYNAYFWKIEKNDKNVFECKLDEGRLKMYVDKEMTSEKFQLRIEKLGEEIKYLISGENPEENKKKALLNAERNLERAKKAYDRALKNVKRTKEKQ